jgi:hypothetical protein
MAIQYTTKVNGLRVVNDGGLTDVVKEVDVTIIGSDSGIEFPLAVTIKLPAPDSSAFTAFADVTEAQVTGWVEAQEDRLQPIKDHIAIVLPQLVAKAVLSEKPLPWAETPPLPPAAVPLANPEE